MENEEEKSTGKIDFKYNLSLYFSFLKKYKLYILLIIVSTIIAESSGIADKFLFKSIVDNGTLFSSGSLAKEAFVSILVMLAIIYLGVIIVRSAAKFFNMHFINRLDAEMTLDLKKNFFNHLITLDWNFHTTHKTGSLISKLTRIGGAVERMTDVFMYNFLALLFQLSAAFISLAYFSFIPAIITAITVIVFMGYSGFIQKIQEKANVISNESEDREKAAVSDMFTNVESVKYFGKEDMVKTKFKNLSEVTKINFLKFWDYFKWMDSIQTLILSLGIFVLVYFTLRDFLAGKTTIGTLVFIYTVFTSLVASLYMAVWGIRNFYRSMVDFESLFQYQKVRNNIKDKPDAKDLSIKNGEIEFKDVSFNYGNKKVLENFNLKVEKNQSLAIVGHSGSGKTTLIKLLYRFYDINSGEIKIDGKNIQDVKQTSLRSEMSIVPQECILFDDTIYNNIKFSNPSASKEKVMEAMRFAQLDKLIEKLPNRENTIVGERGVRLSGGEKQRVSIARAILANKKILVLDEATSSLDSQTEHEIQEDLKELMRGRTTIIIAHRLSTIMSADKIIVMDKGKTAQEGNHNRLISQPGLYRKLWNLQKGGYIKE